MKKLDEVEVEKLWEQLKRKDHFTAQHCRRVSEMLEKFALGSGWKSEDIRNLKIAALLWRAPGRPDQPL